MGNWMPLVVLGVIILLVALLAPIILNILIWIFNNLITTAIILIVIGLIFAVIKTAIKFVFFETNETTGEYLTNEYGAKILKSKREILEGLLIAILIVSLGVFFIQDWLYG